MTACLMLAAAVGILIGRVPGVAWAILLVVVGVLFAILLRLTIVRDGVVAAWQPQLLAAIFMGATFIGRPVQLLWGGQGSLWQSQPELMETMPAALLAVVVFLAAAVGTFAVATRREVLVPVAVRWPTARLRSVVTAATLAAIASVMVLGGSVQGVVRLVVSSFGRRALLESQFYVLLPIYAMVAAVLFCVAAYAQRRIGVLSLVAAVAVCVMVLLPLGGRGEFLRLGIMGLATWQVFGRRIRASALLVALVVAYAIISVGFALRLTTGPAEHLGRQRLEQVSLAPQNVVSAVIRDGFTGFDRFAFALPRIPRDVPFQGWSTIGRLIAAPVPRALWPGKPAVSEAAVTAHLFGTDVGRYPITVVGQAWLQAGVVALVIMGSIQGLIWVVIRRCTLAARTATGRIVCVVAAVTLFGALDNLSVVQFIMRVVPVVVLGAYLERSVDPSRLRRNRVTGRIEEVPAVSAVGST